MLLKRIENEKLVFVEFYNMQEGWKLATADEANEYYLNKAKTSKINQLAINRANKAENSTVEYNGKTYANSQNARIAILNFKGKMTASSAAVNYFTYPEREIVQFVKSDFTALGDLIESNETSLRIKEVGLINQINSCTTVDEVNAIDIDI